MLTMVTVLKSDVTGEVTRAHNTPLLDEDNNSYSLSFWNVPKLAKDDVVKFSDFRGRFKVVCVEFSFPQENVEDDDFVQYITVRKVS